MNRRFWVLFSFLALAGNSPGIVSGQVSSPAAASSANSSYDAPSFAAELHRIAVVLEKKPAAREIKALRDSLPEHWNVSTPDGDYSISSQPLQNQLNPGSLDKAEVWAIHLAEEVESSAKSRPGSPEARTKLDKILAEPEFGAVRPPSAWELLRQRINAWLLRMVLKLLSGISRYPLGGKILFWLLVVVAVGIVAMFVFRFIASRDRVQSLAPSAVVIASLTWQEWIRAAHEAATGGNYREAVHCAYWAGITRLEDAGAVPKDRTKTPREYLRLVTEAAPGQLAVSPTHREPLTALTRKLELIWYANRGARPEDFTESLRQLEALGCSLE